MLTGFEESFWNAWGGLFIVTAATVVAVLVAVLGYRAWRASLTARAGGAADPTTRRLLDEVAAAVRTVSAQGERNTEAIAGLDKRLAAIEAILRQVE